jgi:hypothetical protein
MAIDPKFTEYQKMELIQKCVAGILEGETKHLIKKGLEDNSHVVLTPRDFDNIYQSASNWIDQNVSIDHREVIATHIAHYEDIYKYFREIDHPVGMAKALMGKERLLGLHKKITVVKTKKKIDINVWEPNKYDLNLLTKEEKERMEFLINKVAQLSS